MDFFAALAKTFETFETLRSNSQRPNEVCLAHQLTASIRATGDLTPTHLRKFTENKRLTSRSISSRVAARPLLSNFS